MRWNGIVLWLALSFAALSNRAAPATELPVVPEEAASGELGARMDEFLSGLARFGYNGSVLVAQGGEVLLRKAYGIADARTGKPNTTSTIFSTGSVTKQFTATGILRLVDKGKVNTDDPITKYFSDVPKDKEKITVHHLLTHSSGIADSLGGDSEEFEREVFVKRAFSIPLDFEPGQAYRYSNAGYSLLAIIIEKMSGHRYEDYLVQELFVPEGMKDTGLYSIDFPEDRVARSHNASLGYLSPASRTEKNWNLIGNGGILTTTADLYRWVLALHQDRLISPKSRSKMLTRHISEGEPYFYGYGWSIFPSPWAGDVIWHNGGATGPGWSCAVYQYLADDAVFVVFANKPMEDREPVDDIVEHLARLLHGESIDMPPSVVRGVRSSNNSAFDGDFRISGGGFIRARVADGALHLIPRDQRAMSRLYPSRMTARLKRCNGRTDTLVTALSESDRETIRDLVVEMPGDAEGAWLERWWEEVCAERGAFESIEISGTRMSEGAAKTHCRIEFAKSGADFVFSWNSRICRGAAELLPPAKAYVEVGEGRFAGYSLSGGTTQVSFLEDASTLTIDSKLGGLKGHRVEPEE